MSAWFTLWKRSLDTAAGAPAAIAQRTRSLHETHWTADTLIESNRRAAEQLTAANAAWWSLCRDSLALRWPAMPWPPAGVWVPPIGAASQVRASGSAGGRPLKPITRRARPDKARLRHKAARHH